MSASKKSVSNLATAMLIGLFAVGLFTYSSAYQQSLDQWHNQIRGCERGKKDRAANAKGFRTQRDYLRKVTEAASVKEDVKVAARQARKNFTAVSADLGSRTGTQLDCSTVAPKPSPLPF